MNEVEKMYSNAEPNRDCNLYKHFTECPMKHTQCEDCENFVYPPFTPEKQIELIKWLINEVDYITMWHFNNSKKPYDFDLGSRNSEGETFEDALAQMINHLWQDLTDADKAQIKEILE